MLIYKQIYTSFQTKLYIKDFDLKKSGLYWSVKIITSGIARDFLPFGKYVFVVKRFRNRINYVLPHLDLNS